MSRKHARLIAVAGLAATTALASTLANAQGHVRWKMQSAGGSSLVHLGASGIRFADRFREPGALG